MDVDCAVYAVPEDMVSEVEYSLDVEDAVEEKL